MVLQAAQEIHQLLVHTGQFSLQVFQLQRSAHTTGDVFTLQLVQYMDIVSINTM